MSTTSPASTCISVDPLRSSSGVLTLRYEKLPGAGDELDDVSTSVINSLCAAFEVVQTAWADIVAAGTSGRLIVVAPASAALGDSEQIPASAVTGGLISMVRSLAIELAKSGGTANTILEDPGDEATTDGLITHLASPHATGITGQELYTAGILSTGRLHP